DVQAAWIDTSPAGDGTGRISNGEIPSLLSGLVTAAPAAAVVTTAAVAAAATPAGWRYFGRGDVLRNASLEFHGSARVEIDSLFENCSIKLGEGTELVVGRAGVLADCSITGGGSITIHGQFFEKESPGIVAP